MARVWTLTDPCADPGIFARVVQARLPENSSDNVFVFFVLNFYSFIAAYQWFISKKREGGGQTYSRGGGGGGGGLGVHMLILETHRTFDFPGGGPDPLSPLWIRTCDHLTTLK